MEDQGRKFISDCNIGWQHWFYHWNAGVSPQDKTQTFCYWNTLHSNRANADSFLADLRVQPLEDREMNVTNFELRDICVLIVDDNDINGMIAENIFISIGIAADYASGGAMALHMLQEKAYDLVLIDYIMPEMDGVQVSLKIRALPQYKNLHIVALTSECTEEIRKQFAKAEVFEILQKPVERNKVVTCLKQTFQLPEYFEMPDTILSNPEYDYRIAKAAVKNISTCKEQIASNVSELIRIGAHSAKGILITLNAGQLAKQAAKLAQCTDLPSEDFLLKLDQLSMELGHIVEAYDKAKAKQEVLCEVIIASAEEYECLISKVLFHIRRFEIEPITDGLKELLRVSHGENRECVEIAVNAAYVFDYEKMMEYVLRLRNFLK